MKKLLFPILFVAGLVASGCSSQLEAVNYRFKDDPKLHTFTIKNEQGLLSYQNILLIDNTPQDTLGVVGAFNPQENSLSTWNGKQVEFQCFFHYYFLWSSHEFRVFVDNEKVAIWD